MFSVCVLLCVFLELVSRQQRCHSGALLLSMQCDPRCLDVSVPMFPHVFQYAVSNVKFVPESSAFIHLLFKKTAVRSVSRILSVCPQARRANDQHRFLCQSSITVLWLSNKVSITEWHHYGSHIHVSHVKSSWFFFFFLFFLDFFCFFNFFFLLFFFSSFQIKQTRSV